jgi:cytoskeleton-associated protein 5
MDNIFFDLPAVFGYLDDLLIWRRSAAEHRSHLREVLGRLQANGLLLNIEKCELIFLGHTVSATGIAPLPDRVAAIRKFSPPQTVD